MPSRRITLILFVLPLILLALGCSQTAVEPETVIEQPNFTDQFGGYQPINDSPGFGDDSLLAAAQESDEEYADPMLADIDARFAINDSNSGHYHLRINWGQLQYDSTSTTPTDWTGSLTISRGVEILRRVIRFERGQDYILPRTDRHVIEWVSHTTVHNDGIAVDIFVPPARPKIDTSEITITDSLGNVHVEIVIDTTWPNIEPVTVEFKTAPYSHIFNLDELSSLDTIVYLEDSNAVAFHALKLDRFVCPRGFLEGVWGYDDSGNGLFRGMWMDRTGHVDGFLKGHFGKKENGEQVFYGKWISRVGRFEGFIRGVWGYNDCPDGDSSGDCVPGGFFNGQILNSDGAVIGALAGRFRTGNVTLNVPGGFFQGRWRLECPGDFGEGRSTNDGF